MTKEDLNKIVALADQAQVQHAGTLEDPIPQQLLYAKTGADGVKKIYTVAAGITVGGGSGTVTSVENATETVKGVVTLTDDPNVDAPAAVGSIAMTPNGVKVSIETAKAEIEATLETTIDNALDEAIQDGGKIDNAINSAINDAVSSGGAIDGAINGAIDDALQDGGKLDTAIDSALDEALQEGGKIDSALDNAVDDALQGAITDGSLDDAINGAVDNVVQDKIESGEIGAGSGEVSTLVVKPEIITPTEGAINVASLPTLQASAFKCLLTTETRLHREFELNTVTPDASVVTKQVNADSITLDSKLNPTTQYKWRCRDVTNNQLKSAWTAWTSFTTAQGQTVTTPTITLKGYQNSPTDILSGLTIEGSAFAVSEGEDTHKATSWSIAKKIGTRSNVWESLNDAVNKTSVIVPEGTLEKGTAYTLTVIYHGTAAYDSAPAVVEFTTSADFGTVNAPTLTVQGGPNTVYDTPTLTGGAFSNTRDADTHDMTDWEILDATGATPVWQSLNDVANKTTIDVPNGQLAVSTSYKARVRYHGAKYGWSAYTTVDFSTVAVFSSVNTPTITVSGAPDNVKETPTLTGSAFGGINVTHKSTDWQVLKAQDNSIIWESIGDTSNLLSIKVPKGKLQKSTGYIFKVRYNANEGVSSAYGEATYTTAAQFIRYNYIGVPGTSTFGVGLAMPEVYESVELEPAENCEDETDFQYGLYCRGATHNLDIELNSATTHIVAMKWIPKFWIAPLQKNNNNLSEIELDKLLPYVEVTREQMIEAQRRSPHNAMVIAPSNTFTNESEANEHGFYLMRGFVDGNEEKDGFFISNTISFMRSANNFIFLRLGTPNKTKIWQDHQDAQFLIRSGTHLTNLHYWGNNAWIGSDKFSALSANNAKANYIELLENTPYQCCSIFAWAIISILSLIQGQYATNVSQCAWYDANLLTNYPKGINNYTTDVNDSSVVADRVDNTSGKVFVTSDYEKTTHNGSITGITNVNGWLEQYVIGSWGDGSALLKRSASIYDITYENVDTKSSSCYEAHSIANVSTEWGGSKSSFPALTGTDKDLFGVYAFGGNSNRDANEFGMDYHVRSASNTSLLVGGRCNYNDITGIFYRMYSDWASADNYCGFRAMAYPGGRPPSTPAY